MSRASAARDWFATRGGLAIVLVVIALTVVGGGAALLGGLGSTTAQPSASPSSTTAASGTPGAEPTATTIPTPNPTPTPPPPPLAVAPLTGLLVSPEAARLPVIAVMIDDHQGARPQSGFTSADVVWQAPAEGGIPRYMLLFQSTVPAQVGPVRSAREYFIEWAAEWHAMYTHAGGSPQAFQTLRTYGGGRWIWNADQFAWGSYFNRVNFRIAPHNLYTDGTRLEALATRLGVRAAPTKPVWTFGPDIAQDRRPRGATLTVIYPYESITFRYDWVTNTYRRYIDGSKAPQVDNANQAVVGPKNVVILRMAFGPLNDGHPAKHRLEASDVGHGVAYISTNGTTVKGTWRKASPTAPTLLYGPNGKPVRLTAGQTFVEVIALGYGFSYKNGQLPPPISSARLGGLFVR